MSYSYQTRLEGVSFADAITRTTRALKAEGFGVLTEIDVKATFKKKLDLDFRPYTILGACNPHLAHRALEAEPLLGLLLPCNVVIQQVEEGVVDVSIVRPDAMFQVVDNEALSHAAEEAGARLERVINGLGA